MDCPFCGGRMEDCYLESNSFLYLMRTLHPVMGPVFASKRDKIARLNSRRDGTGIPVHICPSCRKVVFSY